MTAAAYIRVSTTAQDFEHQRRAIKLAARSRGDRIASWFAEKQSASTIARTALAELRSAVQRGAVRRVYVFRIDRLTRSGIRDTLNVVEEFRAHGAQLVTVADGFSLEGPASDVVLAVLAWAAQMERAALGERISAARARIEAAGGRWGRPRKIDPGMLATARAMQSEGRSMRQIAVALKIPKSTLADALSEKGHYSRRTDLREQKSKPRYR